MSVISKPIDPLLPPEKHLRLTAHNTPAPTPPPQANNLIRHFHTSPFSPQPEASISATIAISFSTNSYNLINITLKEIPSRQ